MVQSNMLQEKAFEKSIAKTNPKTTVAECKPGLLRVGIPQAWLAALSTPAPQAALVQAQPGSQQTGPVPAHLHMRSLSLQHGPLNPRFGLNFSSSRPYANRLKSRSPVLPVPLLQVAPTHGLSPEQERGLQPSEAHKTKCNGTLAAPSATHCPRRRASWLSSSLTLVTQMQLATVGLSLPQPPLSLDVYLLPILPLQPSTFWCCPPAFPSTLPLPKELPVSPTLSSPFPLAVFSSGASPLSSASLPEASPSSPALLLHNSPLPL